LRLEGFHHRQPDYTAGIDSTRSDGFPVEEPSPLQSDEMANVNLTVQVIEIGELCNT
jgi:hypothetical protein